jgi:hypothetical protein
MYIDFVFFIRKSAEPRVINYESDEMVVLPKVLIMIL